MGGIAYSCLRFSTPEQSRCDSRRRQTTMAESYATRLGLHLDAALNFRDLGMSSVDGSLDASAICRSGVLVGYSLLFGLLMQSTLDCWP